MNIIEVLNIYFGYLEWCCGDTYESLEWLDMTRPKPTYEEMELLKEQIIKR